MNRFLSLRFGLPIAVLAVLLFLSWVSYLDRMDDARTQMFDRASRSARNMTEAVARVAQWDLIEDAPHVAAEISAHSTESRMSVLALINSEAVVEMAHRSDWAGRQATEVIPGFDIASFNSVTAGRTPDIQTDVEALHLRVMTPFQTRYMDNEIRPARRGVIYLDYDLGYQNARIRADAGQRWLIEAGLASLLAGVLSLILHWRVSRPLVRVQEASERLAFEDEVSQQIPITGPYEIRRLASAYNLMVAKLLDARQQAESGRERLAAIMDSAMDAIITADSEYRVRVINQAALQMFGYTEHEVIGRNLDDFIPERFRSNHTASMFEFGGHQSERVRSHSRRQVVGLRANGQEFPVYAAISKLQVNGESLYTVIMHDVTEELKAESAIRDLNATLEEQVQQRTAKLLETTHTLELQKAELTATHVQLQTIFEAATTGIVLLSQHKIIQCNRKAEEVFGYKPGEMLGKLTSSWYPNEDAFQMVVHQFYSQFKVNALASVETTTVRKDGSTFQSRISGRIIRGDSDSRELVVIVEDITQQAQANDILLRAKEDAEQANQAKSYFLANMSHEIRTPMNGILGLAYILEKSSIPEESRQLVKKIRSTGADLQAIISDILDFSKIESGHLEIEKTSFDLSDVLDRLANTMASNAEDKPIELAIIPPPLNDLALQGDPLRLLQILINLAGNAIKFTQSGFVMVIVEEVLGDETQVALRFAVRDSGIGISKNKQVQIFTPFTQADVSTTRRYGGSGLGLSISRRLVELMGGAIGVSSTEGVGSEFFFTLRFARSQPKPGAHARLQSVDILLASENEVAREAMHATVSSLGWQARVHESGSALVQAVQTTDPQKLMQQVVLLDSQMKQMSALDTVRSIQQAVRPLHEPIILLVRSHSQDELLTRPHHDLIDAVLTKPVTPASLHDAVALALRKRQGQSEAHHPAQGRRLKGLKILVVDDSDINREVSQRIFSDEGAQIFSCNDGQQGLTWLQTPGNEVDLVLMDLQMPIMDGYEATRAIRQQSRFSQLPVIALTAGAFQEQRIAAQAAGLNDFIAKPFDVEVAIEMILRYSKRGGAAVSAPTPVNAKPIFMPVPNASFDLPGLKVGRGLSVWKDAAVYQRFLRKFAVDYQDCVSVIRQASLAEASLLAHKLLGASSNLALDDVAQAAAEIDRLIHEGVCPKGQIDVLDQALKIGLQSIDVYSPELAASESFNAEDFDSGKVLELLFAALKALASDSPIGVEPILIDLDKHLPSEQLQTLRTALDNFDFRGAEMAVQDLADTLGISLLGAPV
jgi:PAS domain S-box-containing protein